MTDKQIKAVFKNGFYCIEPCPEIKELLAELKAKEQECERLKQGYAELTEIVSPYMDDFTGYNEELGGFDVVLCVKQLLEQKVDVLKTENEHLKTKVFGFESKQTSMGEQNKELAENNLNLSKENAELKVENEELKEKCKKYGEINEQETKDYAEFKAANEKLKKALAILHKPEPSSFENKYKATLTEIKGIAENREIFCENCSFCCDEFTCDDCGYVKILQKISECEVSNER